jgi:hypothetical protein
MVKTRHPERSRLKGGAVEGPVFVDASIKQVPRLRLAALGSARDDESVYKFLGVGENANTRLSAGNTGNAGKSLWCLQ